MAIASRISTIAPTPPTNTAVSKRNAENIFLQQTQPIMLPGIPGLAH
jgi:hypothetical protein